MGVDLSIKFPSISQLPDKISVHFSATSCTKAETENVDRIARQLGGKDDEYQLI